MAERKTLPAAVVPEEAYQVLSDFAYSNRMTLSEAVRTLLQVSPPLVDFAKEQKVKLDFGVEAWRGSRSTGED